MDSTGSPQVETPRGAPQDKLQGRKTLKVAGFLEEFEKDDIKKNIDIVELFASFRVELKQRGAPPGKSFMGLCPFHEDHNPSLSVDREKGLFNCFGCGESGDAFDLVEKMKNFGFKEALKFLKDWSGSPRGVSLRLSSTPKETLPLSMTGNNLPPENPVKVSAPDAGSIDLNIVVDYYHKKLFDNPKSLEYLKKRGLRNAENYTRFSMGFADGSLLETLSEAQKEALKQSGIITDKDKEHFQNCLIFPIFDENNQAVGLYGRDIDDDSGFKHRYLKGPHRGVFNRKASRVYDEILLTESIIDALSLIEIGFENVQALYGTNGFTEEHLEILKNDRVKGARPTVILALDNDEAGQRAAGLLKERLLSEGFRVKVISPYSGKDWNEALVSGNLKKEDLKALIEQAAVFQQEDEKELKEGFKVREEKGQIYFTYLEGIAPITYRLTGVKEVFVNSLKVTVKAEWEDNYFIDTVDLYVYRSRAAFASHLAGQFGIEARRVERDLLNILEYLERRREERIAVDEPKKKELTEEERRAGLELLRSPHLFDEIVNDMSILGYVGEDMNKKLLYLCATSRKMDNPISVMIVSESASGKSYLVDTVKKLIPEEETIEMTSLSDQALNFIKDLLNKFLVFGESGFNEQIEHQIREMLSGNRLSRLVTVKDEKTGELITKLYKKEVIVASVMSTTAYEMNPENASRYFLINADESKEQTRRIFEAQRQKYSLERHYTKAEQIPAIIVKHHAAQRLLQKRLIVNPIAPFMDFPDGLMRLRRDHDRFIDLMAVICFLRQYQKPTRSVVYEGSTVQGRAVEYIECDDTDYITAREFVVNGMLSSTLDDLPKSVKRFYEELRSILKEKAQESGLKATEAEIHQREIRKRIDWLSVDRIKRYLRQLVKYEYIVLRVSGNRGQRFSYSLAVDESIENIDVSMIPTIEEIRKKMAHSAGSGTGPKAGQSGASLDKIGNLHIT
jgi:DNA primase catalytic core